MGCACHGNVHYVPNTGVQASGSPDSINRGKKYLFTEIAKFRLQQSSERILYLRHTLFEAYFKGLN